MTLYRPIVVGLFVLFYVIIVGLLIMKAANGATNGGCCSTNMKDISTKGLRLLSNAEQQASLNQSAQPFAILFFA